MIYVFAAGFHCASCKYWNGCLELCSKSIRKGKIVDWFCVFVISAHLSICFFHSGFFGIRIHVQLPVKRCHVKLWLWLHSPTGDFSECKFLMCHVFGGAHLSFIHFCTFHFWLKCSLFRKREFTPEGLLVQNWQPVLFFNHRNISLTRFSLWMKPEFALPKKSYVGIFHNHLPRNIIFSKLPPKLNHSPANQMILLAFSTAFPQKIPHHSPSY